MTIRCAVLDDYQHVALTSADWSVLEGLVSVDVFHDHLVDEKALVSRLEPYEIVVVMRERTPLTASLLERLPALRLIVTSGMRNASIAMVAATKRGMVVCGTASHSEPPAELTWALILALTRNLLTEAGALRDNGPWQQTLGADLCGRRLGLIGLGKVGTLVARVGLAFGMETCAWSPHLTRERARDGNARFCESLDELLADSDIVSIHLGLGDETRGLIGRRELSLMRSGAYLINTSRAAIVDTSALVEALERAQIAGAGIDVFDVEPLEPGHRLRQLGNVVATPHLGYVTERNYSDYFGQAIEDIVGFLAGNPIRVLA